MKPISIIEPVAENPEVAIPIIVGYRGYETVQGINTIYEGSQPVLVAPRTGPHQPFLRGAQVPATAGYLPHVAPVSGGVTLTEPSSDEPLPLPRTEAGGIDYEGVLVRLRSNLRRVAMIDDDIQIQRDRKNVTRIQDEIIGRQPPPPDQIELPRMGPDDEIDVFGPNVGDSTYSDQQIITSDSQLSDEEVGLLEPNPYQVRSVQRVPSVWQRLVQSRIPLVTNPEYTLPTSDTTVPTVDIPTNITNDQTASSSENNNNIPPEPIIHDQLLIQRVSVPMIEQQQFNLFPIFASGMALMAMLLGIPVFLL